MENNRLSTRLINPFVLFVIAIGGGIVGFLIGRCLLFFLDYLPYSSNFRYLLDKLFYIIIDPVCEFILKIITFIIPDANCSKEFYGVLSLNIAFPFLGIIISIMVYLIYKFYQKFKRVKQ